MSHPLIDQLRFTRSEWLRALEGITDLEARQRFMPMNAISWIIGHLTWQEQRYWLTFQQGETPLPELNALVGNGQPATTPPLAEMLAAWQQITTAADPWLDQVTTATLEQTIDRGGWSTNVGSLLLRVIYHYWYHIGEIMAIRQQLGHTGLPDFVGNIDEEAPYRAESSPVLPKEPKAVVLEFWERMQTNNFSYAAELFADDYVCDWPLTNERIRGRDNFAALNAAYPTHGRWTFTIHRCVADGDTVVTEITVTDGLQQGRAITFSTVKESAITNQVEYWPEAYAAPAWQQTYTEVILRSE